MSVSTHGAAFGWPDHQALKALVSKNEVSWPHVGTLLGEPQKVIAARVYLAVSLPHAIGCPSFIAAIS